MNVVCYGAWRAASLLWQPSPGAWALTVACHAVFELTPDESPIVPKPLPLEPVQDDDERAFVEPWGPPAPLKRQPEVIVVGHAHAPPGREVTSLVVRLGVGDLEKPIHVFGETCFTKEGALAAPVPFHRMPLRWERAAGAPHASNPAGVAMGKDAVADAQGRVPLPNLRPMGTSIRSRDEVVVPVGFGPIRPTWPSRVERLHRHAASWDPQRWAEQPLPADFDASYFNVAPPDQALDILTGNESILLEHLHPRFPRLVTRLAAATPCVVASLGGVEHNVPVVCDTLVIDSDRGLAFLIWRGQVPLPHPKQEGVVFVSAARIGPSSTGTVVGALGPARAALPFQRDDDAAATLAITNLPSKPARAALPFQRDDDATATLAGAPAPARAALPFQRDDAAATLAVTSLPSKPASASRPFQRDDDAAATLAGASAPTKPALPFRPVVEDAPSAETLGDAEILEEIVNEDTDPPTLRRAALAKLTAAKAGSQPPQAAAAVPPRPAVPPPSAPRKVAPPPPSTPRAPSARPASSGPTVASSIERCAAVAARLASPGADRAAILEAEDLTGEAWEKEHVRWLGEIHDELDCGKRKLLAAYDAAYMAAIEDLRGPIAAGEYARLSFAADRGEAASVLAELGLPEHAMTRIRRVWQAKMAKDSQVAAEVWAALQALKQ